MSKDCIPIVGCPFVYSFVYQRLKCRLCGRIRVSDRNGQWVDASTNNTKEDK